MWQWQEHKKPLLALRKKDMPKIVGVLFHFVLDIIALK